MMKTYNRKTFFLLGLMCFAWGCKIAQDDRTDLGFTSFLVRLSSDGSSMITNNNGTTTETEPPATPPTTTPTTTTNTVVATPTFNIAPGNYVSPQTISISTTTSGATIYYTRDGSIPTTSSLVYNSGIHIGQVAGKIIKAYATLTGYTDSGVLSGVFSYPPLRTGQLMSFIGGDDGSLQFGVVRGLTGITIDPVYPNDSTTTDSSTGLVWKSCLQGLSGASCGIGGLQLLTNDGSGTDAMNHSTYGCSSLNALNAGNGYSGMKNWRLPSVQELSTLVNAELTNPSLDAAYFPNSAFAAYWTLTMDASNVSNAWAIHMGSGQVSSLLKTSTAYALCVSAQNLPEMHTYKDNGNGTVTDIKTGLFWQRCSVGQTNNATCSGVAGANMFTNMLNACNSLSLAGRAWRLPNRNELLSIVDYMKPSPTIDSSIFPSTETSGNYWTSTTVAGNTTNVWTVNFSNAGLFFDLKANANSVRCVSGP